MSEIAQKAMDERNEEMSPRKELALAARQFLPAAEEQPILKLLLLVDPIQAFTDAGISLSKHTRKYLRRIHPEAAYGNLELYEGVKSGNIQLTWIERIEFGKPREVEGEAEAGQAAGEEMVK